MTVNVSSATITDIEALRILIVNSLHSVIEGCKIIDEALPIPGEPILALNSNNRPMIICFDIKNSQRALMAGLSAVEYIKQQHRLIIRLYPQLDLGKSGDSLTLLIMTPDKIPGDFCSFRQDGSVLFFTFRGIMINKEMALLIDPSPFNSSINEEDHKERTGDEFIEKLEKSLLSEEESKYFS